MKYLLLRLDADVPSWPHKDITISMAWTQDGRGLAVRNLSYPSEVGQVIAVIPVLPGGVAERAIEANIVELTPVAASVLDAAAKHSSQASEPANVPAEQER